MGKGRMMKLAICILLVVSILAFSLSVFGVDSTPEPSPEPTPTVVGIPESRATYYIWMLLKAFGIQVAVNDIYDWTVETRDTLFNLVMEYLELGNVPSVYTINKWIAPWQADFDYWGNYRFNSTMLEDVQDFANWLVSYYSVTDNDRIQISGGLSFRGYTVYQTNTWYSADKFTGIDTNATYIKVVNYQVTNGVNSDPIYFLVADGPDYMTKPLVFFTTTQKTVTIGYQAINLDGTTDFTTTTWANLNFDQNHGGYYINGRLVGSVYRIQDAITLPATSMNQVYSFFDGSVIETEDGVYIESGVIELPDDDPDYTPGDSVAIIDGDVVYLDIAWPESISVDNLPAVISPTTITDPDLEGVYGEVTPFIRTFSGGMDMMRSIIMQLPEESIACLYALIGAIIIFGFIKIMREH